MSAKKYVLYLVAALFLFMILNIFLWHFHVKKFFDKGGELNRLANFYTTEAQTLYKKYPFQHAEFNHYITAGVKESFDLITIGDSFSNGGGGYYQDYLAEEYGLKILNFKFINHCLEDLYVLLQFGLIDNMDIKPKAIILESVERAVQGRLGVWEILLEQVQYDSLEKFTTNKESSPLYSGLFPTIIVQSNFRFLYSFFYRKINPEQLSPEVYKAELDRNFFTNKGQENLLIYHQDDLKYITQKINVKMINKNLNNAAKILEEKNIKLFFMPCVDKYDLYYPYIKDKRGRPENDLFEELRKIQNKNYILIDTKKILRKALEAGEKDLYWLNDTHWSWRGLELVCDELMLLINQTR